MVKATGIDWLNKKLITIENKARLIISATSRKDFISKSFKQSNPNNIAEPALRPISV